MFDGSESGEWPAVPPSKNWPVILLALALMFALVVFLVLMMDVMNRV